MNQNPNNQNFVTLQKVDLKSLEPNLMNVLIVGIIIGKQRPRLMEANDPRAVWNFTLRDSLQQYINVSFWGGPEQIFQANDKFSTGDVVEIVNPQIIIRRLEDRSEQFQPMVTSPYKLVLGERSAIVNHLNSEPYQELLHIPTKPTAMFVPLHDIHNRGGSIQYADVLGAIRGLNQVRTISTRTNEMMQVRDIELFDHTAPSLRVTLWEPDLIHRSMSWKPRITILFMTDLKIDWSNFGNSYAAKASGRTIVTENPVSKEAKLLFEYAQTAPIETFDIVEQLVTSLPNFSAIEEIMSIKQVQDRINSSIPNKQTANKSFTVTLFAFVSELDLDGLSQSLIIKCGHCKTIIKGLKCENQECPVVFENELVEPEITYDIRVALSDHTGTLRNCRLSGHSAETALGCTAKEFSSMSDDEKCQLKWKYLLEQCKVRVAVMFVISQNPVLSILQIERAIPSEVARKLPVY